MKYKSFIRKNAGLILKSEREKKGITQVDLSEKMGFKTGQQLSNIERGQQRLTLELALIASDALKIDASVFIYPEVKQYVYKKTSQKRASTT